MNLLQERARRYAQLRDALLRAAYAEAWSGAQPPEEGAALEAELAEARMALDQFVTGIITGLEV